MEDSNVELEGKVEDRGMDPGDSDTSVGEMAAGESKDLLSYLRASRVGLARTPFTRWTAVLCPFTLFFHLCLAKPLSSEGHHPMYGSSTGAGLTESTHATTPTKWKVMDYLTFWRRKRPNAGLAESTQDDRDDTTPTKWKFMDYLTFWRRKRPNAPSPPRTIHFLRPEQHKDSRFCSNRISTTKYNFLTFLPLFLFDQFRRYANLFFLFISILQVGIVTVIMVMMR